MELSRKLEKSWRFVGAGVLISVFGLGGLFLSLVWVPMICLFRKGPEAKRDTAQKCIHFCFRIFLGAVHKLGVIEIHIENAEELEKDAGCLVVANHPTLLDYVLLGSLMPRCECVVKDALWRNFFLRGIIQSAGYISNRTLQDALEECEKRLRAGGRLIIFPEGTRPLPGERKPIQRGAANLAIRSGADLRLVHITCNPPFLTKQVKWWRMPSRRPVLRLRVGEKIRVARFLEKAPSPRHAVLALNESLACALFSGSATSDPLNGNFAS